MFRAPLYSSSGESIVSIRHLVYVTVCRWPSRVQVWMELDQFHPNLHTSRSPTYSDIYQMSYWYNRFSWCWAQWCSKHVENRNKYIRKIELCVKLVIYKNWTEMHGQQNIKKTKYVRCLNTKWSGRWLGPIHMKRTALGQNSTIRLPVLVYLTHCRWRRFEFLTRWNSVYLQVLLSATPQWGMFPAVSHPQALLGSLMSISWKFQFTNIVSEFVINF